MQPNIADIAASQWQTYAADFNAMTDEQIEHESRRARDLIDEQESWLEAVAAWEAAGKPRHARKHLQESQND